MSESLDIDSPFRGLAMPKSYSGDLRERVIEAVTMEGLSRREAAERFDISASSAIRFVQRWDESGSAGPKPRGGSVSPLEAHAERILTLVAERPDLTLMETVAELLKRRIQTSKSALYSWVLALRRRSRRQTRGSRTLCSRATFGSRSSSRNTSRTPQLASCVAWAWGQ